MNRILKVVLMGLIVGIIFLTGCERKEHPENYVARVNDEYLTIEMILERLDDSYGMNEVMVREYVNQWLTSEMLFQEARRRGLDRDDRVLQPLRDVRRHLAINALLEEEVYSYNYPEITTGHIEAYFEEHKDEFTADAPVVEISYVLFAQRNTATTFRNAVVRGTDWETELENILMNDSQAEDVIEIGEQSYFRERDIYPPEVWRAARQLGAGGVSFPVSTPEGFYIVRHHHTIQTGSPYPIDYVSNEIQERLVIEQRQERYEQVLLDLRRRYPIDITYDDIIQ